MACGHFREVARHLGMFNGDYLSGRPLPTDPWLSRTGSGVGPSWPSRLWNCFPRSPATRTPADSSPPTSSTASSNYGMSGRSFTKCSNACPRPFATTTSSPATCSFGATVALAEALLLIGPSAARAGRARAECARCATQPFMESRPERWDELERDCLDGYADGLRQAGSPDSDEVLLGYLVSTVLRFGIGSAGSSSWSHLDRRAPRSRNAISIRLQLRRIR